MKKIGILLLICSAFVLIVTCTVFGFYEQIKAAGFDFGPLGFCLTCLAAIGATVGTILITKEE